MFARLTTVRIKPERLDDFRRWHAAHETETYAQPGLRQWVGLIGEDGEVVVVAIFDDVQAACDALPAARMLWSQFADMVEGEPTAHFMEVLAARAVSQAS